MIYMGRGVWVGDEADAAVALEERGATPWMILHAAKEPYHRQFVGYTSRGAPKESPEYLFARRGDRLALNFIDAHSAAFIHDVMMNTAYGFIDEALAEGRPVLVHCNKGESRAPGLVFLYLSRPGGRFEGMRLSVAMKEFCALYPAFLPGPGVHEYITDHWPRVRAALPDAAS
jgi:hypothetical protein